MHFIITITNWLGMRSCVERGCTARRLTDKGKKIGANACGERVSQIIAMRIVYKKNNYVKKNVPLLGAHVLGFVPGSGMDFLKPENSVEIRDKKAA